MNSTSGIQNVIIYRYDGSPFANKIDCLLAMRQIPHYEVDVAMTLPRPAITDMLGIAYRRIPLLAIGSDVYCDTSLIVPQLEKLIPPSPEFPSAFPPRKDGGKVDAGIIKAFAMTYADRTLFPLGGSLVPYGKLGEKFIEDRSAWSGTRIQVDALAAKSPSIKSTLSSHMSLVEEQLDDGREWLFDTSQPGFGDLSVHFFWSWILKFRGMKKVISKEKFPKSNEWLDRMSYFLSEKRKLNAPSVKKIKGDEAAAMIAESRLVSSILPFDHDEAERLEVNLDEVVSIVPEDNAKNYPTVGKLIGLNREEMVIETKGTAVKALRCHFPRLNFSIRRVSTKAKL